MVILNHCTKAVHQLSHWFILMTCNIFTAWFLKKKKYTHTHKGDGGDCGDNGMGTLWLQLDSHVAFKFLSSASVLSEMEIKVKRTQRAEENVIRRV